MGGCFWGPFGRAFGMVWQKEGVYTARWVCATGGFSASGGQRLEPFFCAVVMVMLLCKTPPGAATFLCSRSSMLHIHAEISQTK